MESWMSVKSYPRTYLKQTRSTRWSIFTFPCRLVTFFQDRSLPYKGHVWYIINFSTKVHPKWNSFWSLNPFFFGFSKTTESNGRRRQAKSLLGLSRRQAIIYLSDLNRPKVTPSEVFWGPPAARFEKSAEAARAMLVMAWIQLRVCKSYRNHLCQSSLIDKDVREPWTCCKPPLQRHSLH